MFFKRKFTIEEKTKVFGEFLSKNSNTTEEKGRVNAFFIFRAEDHLYGLFGDIWIELHFPLGGPGSNGV